MTLAGLHPPGVIVATVGAVSGAVLSVGGVVATGIDPNNPITWVGAGSAASSALFVLWLFLNERVVPGATYRRTLDEKAAQQDQIEKLHDLLEGRALSVLERTVSLLDDVTDVISTRRLRAELEDDRRRGAGDR